MTLSKEAALTLCVAINLCSIAPEALAGRHGSCNGNPIEWASLPVPLSASSVSFPSGSNYREELDKAITRFRENPSNFDFQMQYGDNSVGVNNGQNETWFVAHSSSIGDSPARAYWRTTCANGGRMLEVDLVYAANTNFLYSDASGQLSNSSYGNSFGGNPRAMMTTMLHELGHAAGIRHEPQLWSLMGFSPNFIHFNSETVRPYLGSDTVNVLNFLYGKTPSASFQDLSVSNRKSIGPCPGEPAYSCSDFTALYDPSGNSLPRDPTHIDGDAERPYLVTSGAVVQAEFTLENNGHSTYTPNIGIYLSTNSWITTTDTLLASFSGFEMVPGGPITRTFTVVLPNGTPGLNRWLGIIVDNQSVISESVESNNATYIPIRYH